MNIYDLLSAYERYRNEEVYEDFAAQETADAIIQELEEYLPNLEAIYMGKVGYDNPFNSNILALGEFLGKRKRNEAHSCGHNHHGFLECWNSMCNCGKV